MDQEINEFIKIFLEKIDNQKIHLISHFDTDGITSAAIMSKTLERLDKQFSLKILKQLDEKEIHLFPKDKIILILDLGSSSLEELSKLSNQIIIIDHHEINLTSEIPNIQILNPHLFENYEDLCSAELTYLISKKISEYPRIKNLLEYSRAVHAEMDAINSKFFKEVYINPIRTAPLIRETQIEYEVFK